MEDGAWPGGLKEGKDSGGEGLPGGGNKKSRKGCAAEGGMDIKKSNAVDGTPAIHTKGR